MFWLTLTLALQAAGQHGPGESLPPTATTLRTATVQQLVDEYRSGEADAAVVEAARRTLASLVPLFFFPGDPAVLLGVTRRVGARFFNGPGHRASVGIDRRV